MERLLLWLFPGDHHRSTASLVARAVLLLFLVAWSLNYFTVRLVDLGESPGVMHLVHLVFHEAGHTITAMLTNNRTLVVFMGSGGQVLVPLVITVAFYAKNQDAFSAAIGLWWTGHAVLDVAPYIQDARFLNLQLLSGGTGKEVEGHDWEYLLDHWHVLNRDIYIAANVATIGRFLMFIAFLWALGSSSAII
ncbi:MAG: uncharacterized protein JWM32_2582 [Verrucomicrobia bacterium]|nr:uncharacterized protein [Verrucomicrobiota bacterium]